MDTQYTLQSQVREKAMTHEKEISPRCSPFIKLEFEFIGDKIANVSFACSRAGLLPSFWVFRIICYIDKDLRYKVRREVSIF